MAKLDQQGRIWYPTSKDKRPQLKRYLDEMHGAVLGNVWTDIDPINSMAKERLGYPTQKPLALLERIIAASSNEGDLILDPFCGCGTTVAAAQALNRRWIGIDITYIAIDLIRRRLEDTYKAGLSFDLDGIPRDLASATALFNRDPFDFERWAVSLVYGQPKEKQRGDRGFDGVIRFPVAKTEIGRVLVSVKGGQHLGPNFVNELQGSVNIEKAQMGVLITLAEPTRGMVTAANHSGSYTWPVDGRDYPKLQLLTIHKLLEGAEVTMPPALSPYIAASRYIPPATNQMSLGQQA